MTTTAAAPPAAARRRGGRLRTWLLLAAVLAVSVTLLVLTGTGEAEREATYDPDNPGGDGGQAVARVLDDQGVDVTVARSADELESTEAGDGTTIVVTSSEQLGSSTVDRLLDHAAGARVVVVDPGPQLLDELGLPLGGASPDSSPLPADCSDPLFTGLQISVDDARTMPGEGCFADTLVPTPGGVEGADLVLLGAGQLLTNDQVLRADNAAVALRLLGQDPRLVWYVASFEDQVGSDGVGLRSLLPDWVEPGLWVVALAAVLLVVWRVRRLGPLATEPLPVVVRAIETTRSRGRLYRRSGDLAHTAGVLRTAARGRAADRLGLGRSHDEPTLLREVARTTDRHEAEVAALLATDAPPPASDRELVALANALAALDREVRRP